MSLTPEQLKLRMSGIGGSDVAAALGLSPWTSQLQLWADKCGKHPPSEETPAMEWGSRLEPVIADKFKDEHPEYQLEESEESFQHPEISFLRSTPDGFIFSDEQGEGIWEAKTSSVDWPDGLPIYYQLQVQHYMYVHSLNYAVVSVLFRGREYEEYTVMADTQAYELDVLPALRKFWATVENDLPVFAPANLNELSWVIGEPVEDTELVADPETMALLGRAKASARIASEADAEAKGYRLELAEAMGQAKRLITDDGTSLASQYVTKDKEILDTKALEKAEPDLCKGYQRTQRGYRALRLNK